MTCPLCRNLLLPAWAYALPRPGALSAIPPAGRANVGVFFRVLVTLRAMSPQLVVMPTLAGCVLTVLFRRPQPQMIRVYAMPNVACMADQLPPGQADTVDDLIDDPMDANGLPPISG